MDTVTFEDYRRHNLNLIPVPAGQKMPIIKWGQYQTKLCELPVTENGALVLGPLSNIMCLDVDNPALFRQWALKYGWRAEGIWREYSPNGIHFYFEYDQDIASYFQTHSVNKTLQKYGFELLIDRSIVIVAPSKISDTKVYGKVHNAFKQGKELPVWVMEAMLECQEKREPREYDPRTIKKYKTDPIRLAKVTPILSFLQEKGRRNTSLWSFGKMLVKNQNTPDEIVESGVIDFIDSQGYPDLPRREIQDQILRGAYQEWEALNRYLTSET